MRYELLVKVGETSRGARRFVADEEYEVGDHVYLGGEVWSVAEVEDYDDFDGAIRRLLCIPDEPV